MLQKPSKINHGRLKQPHSFCTRVDLCTLLMQIRKKTVFCWKQVVKFRVSQKKKRKEKRKKKKERNCNNNKGEIKLDKIFCYISKVICAKGCSNSYNLWKFTWLSHFIPKWHQLIQSHPPNHFVRGQKKGQNVPNDSYWFKTPYELTFPI